jgi:P27 family predicted phage terminase small subunit
MPRHSKPTKLKVLEGAQPCRINRDEPASPQGAGPCPDHLDDVGRDAWQRVVARLDEMGILTLADGESIALYASTYEQWDAARRQIEDEGMTYETEKGLIKPHPLLSTLKECRAQMTRLLSHFGMTPSSRSSLHVQAKPSDDPILAFIAAQARPKAGRKGQG